MSFNRREVLTLAAAGIAAKAAIGLPSATAASSNVIRAIAFDGFPILDPRPVVALADELYPAKKSVFFDLFRARLFEYQWLRALGGQYKNFLSIVDDAHLFAAAQLGLDSTDDKRAQFQKAFLNLKAWPDVAAALQSLKAKGIKLAFLSNMTPSMLNAGISNSQLDDVFDFVLSTDAIRTYKPDPRAYQLGVDAFGLPKEQIAFAAFAGWDVAGSVWFGYPTIWINRLGAKPEYLGVKPDAIGKEMNDIVRFVTERG